MAETTIDTTSDKERTKEKRFNLSFSRKDILTAVIFFAAYIFTAQLSRILFALSSSSYAVFLTPAGVALAGLIILGYRFWPIIAIASILSGLINGTPIVNLLIGSFGSVVQVLVGIYILKRASFNPAVIRIRDMLIFVFIAIATTLISPSFRLIAVSLTNSSQTTSWSLLWLGGIFSVLLITPFLVSWIKFSPLKHLRKNATETSLAFTLLIAVDFLIFWTQYSSIRGISIAIIQLTILFWIAARMKGAHITLALFLTSVIGLSGPFLGSISIEAAEFSKKIVGTELYLIIFAILFYSLAALSEERNSANKHLNEYITNLQKAIAKIKEDDRAKTEFISILAHELRNPLAPVVSYLEPIKKTGTYDANTKNYLDTIENNISNISKLLDDLMDVSRIYQQKFEMHKEVLNLKDLLNFAVNTSQPMVHARKHKLHTSLPADPVFTNLDPVRFQQVLLNLISNAVKYTKPGGEIHLSCQSMDGHVFIKVKDNGQGISPEMLKRVFEPFVQTESKYLGLGGLGIGLYLSKKFVEMHSGTLSAHSAGLGQGSEFTVILPIEMPTAFEIPVTETMKSGHKTVRFQPTAEKKFRILVVDDNESAAQSLGKLLEYVGNDVEIAYDGPTALELAKEFRPKVVLLDIGLPGMNGYEVAPKLRKELGNNVTIIALTGYGQEEDKLRSKKYGFDHHLTKPIGLKEVQEVLTDISEPKA